MSDERYARYVARAANLVAAFRQLSKDEHPNVIAEAALAFLAEALANHPSGEDLLQRVLEELPTIMDEMAQREPDGDHRGSA